MHWQISAQHNNTACKRQNLYNRHILDNIFRCNSTFSEYKFHFHVYFFPYTLYTIPLITTQSSLRSYSISLPCGDFNYCLFPWSFNGSCYFPSCCFGLSISFCFSVQLCICLSSWISFLHVFMGLPRFFHTHLFLYHTYRLLILCLCFYHILSQGFFFVTQGEYIYVFISDLLWHL